MEHADTHPSIWETTASTTGYPPLEGGRDADVVVLGGGISGLSAALALKEAGRSVLLLEAGTVGSGVTAHTTAKVTSLHGATYSLLERERGKETAAGYAAANEAGLAQTRRWVEAYAVACGLETQSAYTYTEDPGKIPEIDAEYSAARRAGLDVVRTDETPLPYPVAAAVRLDDQAMFHPTLYCAGLAAALQGDGSSVLERTRALHVRSRLGSVTVETDRGDVRAEQVVLATHLPFHDPALLFARAHPERSYALAARVEHVPEGMHLSIDTPTRSVRPYGSGDPGLVIVGGEGHKVGQEPHTKDRYERLEAWTRERMETHEVVTSWSAQDYVPADSVPFVGRLQPGSDRLYVVAGFRKWGMAHAAFAGKLLADVMEGREHPQAGLYDPLRLNLRATLPEAVKENVDVAKHFVLDRVRSQSDRVLPEELAPGEGGLVEADGETVAAYRDETGELSCVRAVCTHMGCLVAFNGAERSWDCPCHGSRFDTLGRVLQGPATKDLERVEAPQRPPSAEA